LLEDEFRHEGQKILFVMERKEKCRLCKKNYQKTGSWEKLTSGQKQEGAVQHEFPKWVRK
jgi:hypothetical protein